MWAGAAITHPLLDMLTDGGSGVMILFPFTTERFFFPWRPIRVSPLSVARFFDRAGGILRSELPFCAAAMLVGLAVRSIMPRRD
jgi:inner membrane protein